MPLHINNWISKADPDYYTMFIKAWIPFNAWYFAQFETTQDLEGLRKVKTTNNAIKNRIVGLLTDNDSLAIRFRADIASLHRELVQRTVYNYRRPLSFHCIKLDEYFPDLVTHHEDGVIYKIIPHRSDGFKVLVVSGDEQRTFMHKTFNPYSLENLRLDNQFITLPSDSMRHIVQRLFEQVDPTKPFDLVLSDDNPESLLMSHELNIRFKKDIDLVSKALIQVLYELRCLLFHGILDPTPANQVIYEHAYNIMNILIKELRQWHI